jgi:dUTPase
LTNFSHMILSKNVWKKAPRSGLALKNSIDVGAGVIDRDYRGNVGVILFNHSDVEFKGNLNAMSSYKVRLILEIKLPLATESLS